MNTVAIAIREKLLLNPDLVALVGDRIYPAHPSAEVNPTFPAISFGREGGGDDGYAIGSDFEQKIDIWTKGGYDEMWLIYNLVKGTINRQVITSDEVVIYLCKEVYVNDNLYEPDTQTHHLASRYKIKAR